MGIDDSLRKILESESRTTQAADHAENSLLKTGGPGGTSSGMSEDWKDAVDRQLGQLHDDMRSMLRGGIGLATILVIMIGGLYFYFNLRFDNVNQRISEMHIEQAKIAGEARARDIEIEAKLDALLDRKPEPKDR